MDNLDKWMFVYIIILIFAAVILTGMCLNIGRPTILAEGIIALITFAGSLAGVSVVNENRRVEDAAFKQCMKDFKETTEETFVTLGESLEKLKDKTNTNTKEVREEIRELRKGLSETWKYL